MRSHSTPEIPTLAADESLSYVREVETLEAEIETLYRGDRDDPRVRRALGSAHHRLGMAVKLASVHAHLAVSEQVAGLRADLRGAPADVADVVRRVQFGDDLTAVADAVGVVRPFLPGEAHHCGPHCPETCDLDARTDV